MDVDCETCDGTGEVFVRFDHRTMGEVYGPCPECCANYTPGDDMENDDAYDAWKDAEIERRYEDEQQA